MTDTLDTTKRDAIQDTNIQRFRHLVTGSLGPSETAYLVGHAPDLAPPTSAPKPFRARTKKPAKKVA